VKAIFCGNYLPEIKKGWESWRELAQNEYPVSLLMT
jgi:hypothetical protein